jgi:hypothetical protein
MEASIEFDTTDFPKNMAGAEQLPLVVFPTIANVRLYHILIDGGAGLNLISLAAFQKLQIPMSRLSPSCPFSGVGPCSIIPHSSISLPLSFEMPENYHTESVIFNVADVNLPFDTIIGRSAMYQFMAITHYGFLVLKMSSANGIIKIHGDRTAGISTLDKLQVLAVAHEVGAGQGAPDQAPLSLRQRVSSSAPRM